MSEEGFFKRWSRLKSTGGDAAPAEPPRAPAPPAPALHEAAPARPQAQETPAAHLPTIEDAALLTPDADFSRFVAAGVDKSVQRLALKKLFADPHFNAIDGLDIYMNDYNKAAPLTPAMLASLKHAPGVLRDLFGDDQTQEQTQNEAAQAAAGAQEPLQEPVPEPEHESEHELEQAPPSTYQGNA